MNFEGVIESAPQDPSELISSFKHLSSFVLQPTPWARSQSAWDWQGSSICPATGFWHLDCPVGHVKPVLQELLTHAPPCVLTSLHVPHSESGARAQNVLWHWASSPHAAPFASAPGFVAHALPRFEAMKSSHDTAGSAAAQASVSATVALVPWNENF